MNTSVNEAASHINDAINALIALDDERLREVAAQLVLLRQRLREEGLWG